MPTAQYGFSLYTVIVSLNMLIAMMGETFSNMSGEVCASS